MIVPQLPVYTLQLYPAAPYDPNAPKRPPRHERFPTEYRPPPTGHITGEEKAAAVSQGGNRQRKRIYQDRPAGPMPGKKRRRNLDEVANSTGECLNEDYYAAISTVAFSLNASIIDFFRQ